MATYTDATSRGSELVNDTVNTLPILAGLVVDDIVTGDNVGAVLSIVTELASVIDVTAVPALPATSLKVIATATTPSGSGEATVMVAVHASPTHTTDAARPAIVHAAVPALSASEAVKATVMMLPELAGVVVDDIVTGDSVGLIVSIVTELESEVDVTAVPALPATSLNAIEKVACAVVSPACTDILAEQFSK